VGVSQHTGLVVQRESFAAKKGSRQQRRAAARAGKPEPVVPVRRYAVVALAVAGTILIGLAAWLWWPRATSAPSPVQGRTQDGTPSWLPDGHQIVFSRRQDGQADLFVMHDDGSGVRQITTTPSTDESCPVYSPDGAHVVFESSRADGTVVLLVMDADGGNTRVLSTGQTHDLDPAWSPDGKQIVFASDRDGAGFGIYRTNADGSAIERLTDGASDAFPQYSPDGTKLAFHVGRDIAIFDLTTKVLTRLTEDAANGTHPAWSPDGTRLAFTNWRSGRGEIFTMKADGSDQRVLVSMPGQSAIDPRWSPDGARIVFAQTTATGQSFLLAATAESTVDTVVVATGQIRRISK